MSIGKLVAGVVAGVAVGALLGVLFAPDKGSVTRRKLSKGIPDSDDLKEKFDELLNNLNEKYEEAIEEATELYEKGKHHTEAIQKDIKTAMN